MDDVVEKIDALAREENTNRSNLINRILADYLSLVTPEKRIDGVFEMMCQRMDHQIFSLFREPYSNRMLLKSSLDYRYRPTIKYEVELYRSDKEVVGELKVVFRAQSAEFLSELQQFFDLWMRLEKIYLSHFYMGEIGYRLEPGRFFRTFRIPEGKHYDTERLSKALCSYIRTFDDMLKGYLSGKLNSATALENRYLDYLNSGAGIL
jgi:hypothetical protein